MMDKKPNLDMSKFPFVKGGVYAFDFELTVQEMEMADKAIRRSPPDHSVLDSIADDNRWWIYGD